MQHAPSPYSISPPSTPAGDQKLNEFIHNILHICGDVRRLWIPKTGDTTTTTDSSLYGVTWTYDATVAARFQQLGSGWQLDFDGTDDEADTPDTGNQSFGDGANDAPLSIAVLCTPDVNNAAMTLLAKENSSSAEEWNFGLNASGHLVLTLTDESATATLLGTYATAVGTAATLLGSSYDGSKAATGISNYKDGDAVTTAAGGSGTYIAMENTAALVHLGARYTTKAQFFNGKIAFAVLTAKFLTDEDHFALKELVNGYYDLTL